MLYMRWCGPSCNFLFWNSYNLTSILNLPLLPRMLNPSSIACSPLSSASIANLSCALFICSSPANNSSLVASLLLTSICAASELFGLITCWGFQQATSRCNPHAPLVFSAQMPLRWLDLEKGSCQCCSENLNMRKSKELQKDLCANVTCTVSSSTVPMGAAACDRFKCHTAKANV